MLRILRTSGLGKVDRPRILDERFSHQEWLPSRRSCKLQPLRLHLRNYRAMGLLESAQLQEALTSIFQLSKCFLTTLRPTSRALYTRRMLTGTLWRLIYLMVSCKSISNLVGKSWISLIHSWLLLLTWAQSFSIYARTGRCWINFGVRRSTLWRMSIETGWELSGKYNIWIVKTFQMSVTMRAWITFNGDLLCALGLHPNSHHLAYQQAREVV